MTPNELGLIYWLASQPHKAKEVTLVPNMITAGPLRDLFTDITQGVAASDNFGVIDLVMKYQGNGLSHVDILLNASKECFNYNISGNVKHLENQIRRDHNRAKQISILAEMMEAAKSGNDDQLSSGLADLLSLNRGDEKHDFSFAEMLDNALEWVEHKMSGETHGVSCGFKQLNAALGAFHNSDLIIIAARSAMGKTAFLLNLALKSKGTPGIISAEQPNDQMGLRSMVIESGANMQRIRSGNMSDTDAALIARSMQDLKSMNGRIYDKPQCTIGQVQAKAREWVNKYGVDCLYVDYLQDIRANNTSIPKHEQVAEVSSGLKNIARELKIPVIALAQVNRNVESRPTNKRPGMSDIKDSGQIEQDADQIITLYRDEYYNPDTDKKGVVEVDIKKNRHGQTGCIEMEWRGSSMQFVDRTEDDWH